MKPISKAGTATLLGLSLGQNKIQRSETFMAVYIEELYTIKSGTLYSLAHYYQQNGDLMADPEMEFIKSSTDDKFYPISFRMDGLGIHRYSVRFTDETISHLNLAMQYDQVKFANQWLRNIATQQQV